MIDLWNESNTWVISLIGMDVAIEDYVHLVFIEEIFKQLQYRTERERKESKVILSETETKITKDERNW